MTAEERASGEPVQIKRRPAQTRRERRTVHVVVAEGDYAGWECTAYADFKARLYADMQSDDLGRILGVLDKVIISHNFPDEDDPGILAASMGDVDNEALKFMAGEVFDAISKLPNR